jgi:hypothetical protein
MLVPNLIVINYPKPTTGANALTGFPPGGLRSCELSEGVRGVV